MILHKLSVIVFVGALVSVPLLLAFGDSGRRRLYVAISFAPALDIFLLYAQGFNAYVIVLVGVMYITPLSLLITLPGILLTIRARMRREAWGGLAFGTLLAASPALFFIGLLGTGLFTELRTGHS